MNMKVVDSDNADAELKNNSNTEMKTMMMDDDLFILAQNDKQYKEARDKAHSNRFVRCEAHSIVSETDLNFDAYAVVMVSALNGTNFMGLKDEIN